MTEAVLGAVVEERSKGPKQFKQLAYMAEVSMVVLHTIFSHDLTLHQPDRARVATQILHRNSGRLDVVYPRDPKDDADTPWEEVVMNIQGYIVEKELPPIVHANQ